MKTASSGPGTPAGFQLPSVNQSVVEAPPVQVLLAACETDPARKSTIAADNNWGMFIGFSFPALVVLGGSPVSGRRRRCKIVGTDPKADDASPLTRADRIATKNRTSK
jgi:hypothetical protein